MSRYIRIRGDEVYETEPGFISFEQENYLYKLIYAGEEAEIEFEAKETEGLEYTFLLISNNKKDWKLKLRGKGYFCIESTSEKGVEIEVEGDIRLNLWGKTSGAKPIRLKTKKDIDLLINSSAEIIDIRAGKYWFDGKIWSEEEWEIKEIVE